MRFLPLTIGLFLLSAPALAQITVINEDGSQTTFSPGQETATKLPPAPEPEVQKAPEPEPTPQAEETQPEPEFEPEPIPDPEPKPKAKEPEPQPKQKPAPKPKTAEKQPVEAEPVHILDTVEWEAPPVPPRKPLYEVAEPVPEKPIIPPHPREIKVISQNTAIGIALDKAPPSKDFKVFAQEYKGKPAYSVMFRTEDGPYEVLVDAVTGRILDKGYLQ